MTSLHHVWSRSLRCPLVALLLLSGALRALGQQTYTLSGYVLDAESKETLIGAAVYAPELKQGVYTNAHGFFSLTLNQPISQLSVSYVGYTPRVFSNIKPTSQSMSIELRSSETLDELVVTAESRQLRAPVAGALEIPVHIIKATPALLGESDLMKALQMTPGVQSGTDGSAGIHVRGGGPDENLIILDGVPVYNVDHLFGFFSVFTPEAVKKVDLYKGSFPARYGGRLSSVVDVRTNDGNLQSYHGTLSIGLLSAKAHLEGPIIKDRTSINVSARRSYLDLMIQPFLDEETKGGFYFYDFNAKIQHRLSNRDRLYLSAYKGLDRFHSNFKESSSSSSYNSKGSFDWGNTLLNLRWNHIFSDKLYADWTASYTRYHFDIATHYKEYERGRLVSDTHASYHSGIRDLASHLNLHYIISPQWEMRFGAEYIHHRFEPEAYGYNATGEDRPSDEAIAALKRGNRTIPAHDAAVYIESKRHLGKRWLVNIGLRGALFAVDGKSYLSVQPRMDVDYKVCDQLSVQLAFAHMSQNVHLLTSAMTLPTDLWVPTTGHIKPMTSDQLSLGAKLNLGKGWSLTGDLYYKQMANILEYKDGASFIGNSLSWESKVEMGKGRAYGLELMLMKQMGRTTGWLGYALSRSERRFPDGTINGGRWFPYKYDRRHSLNLVISHQVSRRIDLSASWEMYTGGTMTVGVERQHIAVPDGDSEGSLGYYGSSIATYIPERNNYRLPITHRLNASINFNRFHKNGARSIWNISVFNLYNAKNPSFILPGAAWDSNGESHRLTKFTLLPLIPSVSYTYKF